MKPDCDEIWPNDEFPAVVPMLFVITRFSMLTISSRICAKRAPPSGMFLDSEKSTFCWVGVRTSVMVRGALPYVNAAAVVKAAGFSHVAAGWSADARRSARLPEVSR